MLRRHSRRRHPDVDGHAVRDHVEHCRARAGRARRPRAASPAGASPLTLKVTRMLLEAVADLVGEAERAAHVHVAFEASTRPRVRRPCARRRRRRATSSGTRPARAAGARPGSAPVSAPSRIGGSPASTCERLVARGVLLAGAVERPGCSIGCARRRASRCVARNWNVASSGCALIASSVPYICCDVHAVADPLGQLRHVVLLGTLPGRSRVEQRISPVGAQ